MFPLYDSIFGAVWGLPDFEAWVLLLLFNFLNWLLLPRWPSFKCVLCASSHFFFFASVLNLSPMNLLMIFFLYYSMTEAYSRVPELLSPRYPRALGSSMRREPVLVLNSSIGWNPRLLGRDDKDHLPWTLLRALTCCFLQQDCDHCTQLQFCIFHRCWQTWWLCGQCSLQDGREYISQFLWGQVLLCSPLSAVPLRLME